MTSTSPPPRRFKAEPIENTSTKKVRRFAPEPVESTSKSSKKFTPQPIASTTSHSGEQTDHKIEGTGTQDTQSTIDDKPKPKRRFDPQPVETTSKQSRAGIGQKGQETAAGDLPNGSANEVATTRRRRFAPEPVEVASKSSRKKDADSGDRMDADLPPSGGSRNESDESSKPVRRKFAPEPVETYSKSSRSSKSTQIQQSDSSSDGDQAPMLPHEMELGPSPPSSSGNKEPQKHRFLPEPIESASRSSRTARLQSAISSTDDVDPGPLLAHEGLLGPPPTPAPPKPARRKFAPQLMETAKRSRKSGDEHPAVLPHDKTNATGGASTPSKGSATPKPHAHVSISTPEQSDEDSPRRLSRNEQLVQQREKSRARSRQHSFKVPTLPDIDSSESEESRSNSRSQSHYGDSDTSDETYKNATRMRESVDGRFSGYLLALAARAVDKQMRDQAAAAFPNSDVHEPVAHYVDRSDSEEEVLDQPTLRGGKPDPTRRDSGDEKWALEEMQRHAEGVKERGRKKSVGFRLDRRGSKGMPAAAGGPTDAKHKKMIGGYQRDPDLKQMRKAASPPMLGAEIEFPRCASPENARFDVTQGADFLRKQMCYLTEQTTQDKTGLWARRDEKPTAIPTGKPDLGVSGTWGKATSGIQSPRANGGANPGGLWGGFCTAQDDQAAALPSGLQTPLRTPSHTPSQDPFLSIMTSNSNAPALPVHRSKVALAAAAAITTASGTRTPRISSSPPSNAIKMTAQQQQQQQFAAAIDERLAQETAIEAEFNDAFVTQVYNYLSLGYPSLARKFDDELARISHVPVEELRAGDKGFEARGHVKVPGLNEDEWDEHDRDKKRPRGEDVVEDRRWKALKRYVKEWARQMGRREKEAEERGVEVVDVSRAWGLPVRKGSWGL